MYKMASDDEIRALCRAILTSHAPWKVILALETLVNRDKIAVCEAQRAWESSFGFRVRAIPDRSPKARAEVSFYQRWRRFVKTMRGQSVEDREIEVLCLVTMRVSGQFQVRQAMESVVRRHLATLAQVKRVWRDVFLGKVVARPASTACARA